jgi:hypothetical protein
MGVRRDRPGQETGSGSLNLRLGDGSTVSVSIPDPRRASSTEGICCFCGEEVDASDPRHVTLSVRWSGEQGGDAQSWSAHDTCLAERLHERVRRAGVFPDR